MKFLPEMFLWQQCLHALLLHSLRFVRFSTSLPLQNNIWPPLKMLPFGEIYCSCDSSGLRISCNKNLSAREQRTFYWILSPRKLQDFEYDSFYIWNDFWTLLTHCSIILQLWSSCNSVNTGTSIVPRAVKIHKCPTAHAQYCELNWCIRCRCCGQECGCNCVHLYFGFLLMIDVYTLIALFSRIGKINGPIYRTIRWETWCQTHISIGNWKTKYQVPPLDTNHS